MKKEEIQNRIAYIEGEQIKMVKDSIAFYKSVGARKDLSDYYAELASLEKAAANLKLLLDSPQKGTGLKVKVTEYKKRLVIQTVDIDNFDSDFVPNGNGRIGCSLSDNSRLGVSKEALELMETYRRVGDVIGDLMGEADNFTWIGGPLRVLDTDSVVCRYFKMPKGYVVIDNDPPKEAIENIEKKSSGGVTLDYADFEQELWISLSRASSWEKKKDGSNKLVHVYHDYYKLEDREGGSFVGGRLYDKEVVLVNVPEGMVTTDSEGHRTVLMPKELKAEILSACRDIFRSNDEPYYGVKIPDSELMSYINPLFDLGFDNNIMNPRDGYWRMSIKATPKVILEKLRSFKRETAEAERIP